ncbi:MULTISPECIES: hypothetical protein [Vibrio]|uniref:Imelysin-like domain-containing protein n=1 Tax=Vibrio tasmaniensis TaxID=212663 RepID=A0A2N7NNC4_9VIBR|nr:hypothetical protein [Vibrio tasmaniensis]PMO80342.1 hypothetical protein BCT01_08605 [Vibrio tasmaniensis]PMP17790.1 hypothetical protein BCS92_05125 [Vibrio tasmaniensis]TKG28995.1 hypothetical protein FC057_20125 [Vibrio tasmaniensis]TKG41606.1 hypothetical protein FC063_07025 [Vibrio tasmaniensis]TKG46255.1 hypothetical protein FC070_22490 [Vibrio tasmaniensis]
MRLKVSKWALCSLATITVIFSNHCVAFTPAIQAALFNSSVRELNIIQQERLISYTESLYKTLNTKESTSLIGHQQLKVSSYMYLVNYWLSQSIEQILYERGEIISEDAIIAAGIDSDAYSIPLKYTGPLNLAFNKAKSGAKECLTSINPTYKKNYQDIYNTIVALFDSADSLKIGMPARAALLYLKSHFYLKLHVPNSTFTYVNNKCVSDINGLLTCADKWVERINPSKQHLNLVRRYMEDDINAMKVDRLTRNRLLNCNLTMYHFIQSGAVTEPLNDGQTVAASESLFNDMSGKLKRYASSTTWDAVFKDNQSIMNYLYNPEEFKSDVTLEPQTIGRSLLLNQMKAAAIRLSIVLNKDLKVNINITEGQK